MLIYVFAGISLIADALISAFGGLVNSPWDFWKPILIFAGLFLACLVIYIILLIIVSRFAKEEGKIHEPTRWMTVQIIDVLRRLMGVKLHLNGFEKIPTDERFVLVSNHIKAFDPILGLYVFRKYRLAYISKKENAEMPVGDGIVLGCGSLAIDRENDRAALKTILQAIKILKNGEMSIGVYPEGYTNKTDKPLLPFRNGVFKIPQKANVPLVVTTIAGSDKILNNLFRRRTHVYIDVLRVIPHSDIDGIHTNEVGELVYDIMLKNIEKRRNNT
jgi:1-acyl-sn-glycerol-3-phosphate acyltransferase